MVVAFLILGVALCQPTRADAARKLAADPTLGAQTDPGNTQDPNADDEDDEDESDSTTIFQSPPNAIPVNPGLKTAGQRADSTAQADTTAHGASAANRDSTARADSLVTRGAFHPSRADSARIQAKVAAARTSAPVVPAKKPRTGILGLAPVVVVVGIIALHIFVVRAVTN